ncbi:MAG: Rieske (2Fe-2S) protein [Bryobacteraceae bacterium]|nr:Rieske (2Fe-2S) protein [Solibacteraceae bacterium]MCO5350147.1 Rieske (2Fe-2S) protein [Bryobacteraceae bacterium]MDL1892765.1 Rieske (2Fe-2S) protein [Sphingobacteriales bacterium CHB3]
MPSIPAISLVQLPPGSMASWEHEELTILLCNDNGEIRAIEGLCPHARGPLAQGNFLDGLVICPWHAWEFDTASGQCTHNPRAALAVYPIEVRDGIIHVQIPESRA